MTPRQLARMLQNEHETKPWPLISQEHYYGLIPGGTLSAIAKREGAYIPKKWVPLLGVSGAKRKVKRPVKRLSEMSVNELRYCFTNRVEM